MEKQPTIFDSFLYCIQNYAKFDGRARRREYWGFTAVNALIGFVIGLLGSLTGSEFLSSTLPSIVSLALLVPGLAVCWRRLHDIGKKGSWYFIGLVPLVGFILLLVWFCQDSQPGANEFGPNPKEPAGFGGPTWNAPQF